MFFQQASTAAKTSTMVRQFSATLAESRIVLKGSPFGAIPFNVTPVVISAGAAPQGMVASATALSNPFGGNTFVFTLGSGSARIFILRMTSVPQQVCARLLTATSGVEWSNVNGGSGGTTIVSSGFIGTSVAPTGFLGTERNFLMNPTEAGWMCKYGSSNYGTKTSQPNSTPLSGNVDIDMMFLVDG